MSRSVSSSNLFRNQRLMAEHLGERFGFEPDLMRWTSGRLEAGERREWLSSGEVRAKAADLKLAPVIPVAGFTSVFTKDRHGTFIDLDKLDQRAWKENPVGFLNHWPDDPILRFDPEASEIRDDPKSGARGLHDEGVIFGDTRIQKEAQFQAVQRVLATFSIGFITTDYRSDTVTAEDGTEAERSVLEVEILEKSAVTIPSNREALFDIAEAVERGSDIACPRCATDPAQLVRVPNLVAALTSMSAHLEEAVRKGSRDELLQVAEQLEGHLERVRTRCSHVVAELPDAGRDADEATATEVAALVAVTLETLERDVEAGRVADPSA